MGAVVNIKDKLHLHTGQILLSCIHNYIYSTFSMEQEL